MAMKQFDFDGDGVGIRVRFRVKVRTETGRELPVRLFDKKALFINLILMLGDDL